MKDGRTHLAHTAEHAVDLDTGAILGVTVQDASAGDTTTLVDTLVTAAEQVEAVGAPGSRRWWPTRDITATRRWSGLRPSASAATSRSRIAAGGTGRARRRRGTRCIYGNTIDDRIYSRLFERLGVFEGALGALEPVLGDMIQELTHDLFTKHLTPEQEEARIRQAEVALENQRLGEEALEREAAQLTAYGDYILQQVRAARELHRTISATDIQSYVIDFFGIHYRGSEFRQTSTDAARFEVNLSSDARHDLAAYVRKQRVEGSTRLVRDTASRVRCRFENTAVPDVRGHEEVISQFHPLVRFVANCLEESEEQRRPAVAIRLSSEIALKHLGLEIAAGQYVFSVQRWSVQGLRDMERLYYAAAAPGPERNVLEPRGAEQLIVAAAGYGIGWPEGRGAVDLGHAVRIVQESCVAPSEQAFDKYVGDLEKENADRADVQERMLDEHYETTRRKIDEVLRRYRERGQQRLIPATEGRLSALRVRTERRRREIAERRALKYSPPAIVCVGIINVELEVDGRVTRQ